MTKFPYITAMHRELRKAAPEGYQVSARCEIRGFGARRWFTVITCADPDYIAPWFVHEIVEPYGFRRVAV